ncbi:MAG: hypothetical protein GYB32_04865 [Algicola sp.]|nr:hypothetical protein [Algicola sp.]
MKNFKIIILTILSAQLILSCSVDDEPQQLETDFATTPYVVGFNNDSAAPSYVTDGSVNVFSENIILIGGQDFSNTPSFTVNFEVDPSSTAVAGTDYDFANSSQSITIPENRDFGTLDLNIYSENIDIDNPKVLVLNISSASNNAVVASAFQTLTITINGICFSDIGGMYSVTTTYGYHDFLPTFSTHTMDVELVDLGDGQYSLTDMSGGLYTVGPYVAAYGTGPTSFDVVITENCGDISWTDQNDPWGLVVPLDGGVNAVDPDTGVITISWFCEGYGENGVSVYTPL